MVNNFVIIVLLTAALLSSIFSSNEYFIGMLWGAFFTIFYLNFKNNGKVQKTRKKKFDWE